MTNSTAHRWLAAVLAVSVIATPASGSDFSKLAQPSFARFLLLPAKRQRHLECAGLARYLANTSGSPGKAAADRLMVEVGKRLAIELDDPKLAEEMMEGKAASHADPLKTDSFWEETRRYLAERCSGLFEAAGKGDAELLVALGAMPNGPLPLPSPEQCLAVATRAQETGQDDAEDLAAALRNARIDRAEPAERAKREAAVAGGLDMLRSMSVDSDQLQMMVMACVPTVREATKDLPPEAWKPAER